MITTSGSGFASLMTANEKYTCPRLAPSHVDSRTRHYTEVAPAALTAQPGYHILKPEAGNEAGTHHLYSKHIPTRTAKQRTPPCTALYIRLSRPKPAQIGLMTHVKAQKNVRHEREDCCHVSVHCRLVGYPSPDNDKHALYERGQIKNKLC